VLKSIWAVFAGFAVATALALGADYLVMAAAPQYADPQARVGNAGLLAAMLAYTALFGAAGAWVTAWLAPRRPMMHAVILGVIALLLALTATTVFWATAPAWYHVLSVLLVLPAAWAGGWLFARPGRRRAVSARGR
jgi:hypothetical protein